MTANEGNKNKIICFIDLQKIFAKKNLKTRHWADNKESGEFETKMAVEQKNPTSSNR